MVIITKACRSTHIVRTCSAEMASSIRRTASFKIFMRHTKSPEHGRSDFTFGVTSSLQWQAMSQGVFRSESAELCSYLPHGHRIGDVKPDVRSKRAALLFMVITMCF